jgi:archaellum component FlaC
MLKEMQQNYQKSKVEIAKSLNFSEEEFLTQKSEYEQLLNEYNWMIDQYNQTSQQNQEELHGLDL